MTTNSNEQTQPHTDDDEKVFKLRGEIEAELARLKKRPPTDVKGIVTLISGTIMPILLDLAHYSKEHTSMIYELLDQIDGGGSDETQFTQEHAQKFDLVVTYAREIAKLSLESGELQVGSDQHKKCTEILGTADECIKILEESTLTDGDDDEEEGEEEPTGAN